MTVEISPTTLSKSQLTCLSELYHEQKSLQRISAGVKEDIIELQKELQRLQLEKQWCFDSDGRRIRPSPEEESQRICMETVGKPEYKNDVIVALKEKKTWLQMEVAELEEKLKKAKQKSLFEKVT